AVGADILCRAHLHGHTVGVDIGYRGLAELDLFVHLGLTRHLDGWFWFCGHTCLLTFFGQKNTAWREAAMTSTRGLLYPRAEIPSIAGVKCIIQLYHIILTVRNPPEH